VTVFERSDRAGGLLMYGIPNMKLDKAVVAAPRCKLMQAEGVEFRTGTPTWANKNVPADRLAGEYDAVVLCCGAKHAAQHRPCLGRSAAGVHFAVTT
jgi:glutamate synthase (NADPH/NADH) small chain